MEPDVSQKNDRDVTVAIRKPFADLDSAWGQGIVNSDQFAQIVYLTL
jgi:hypothetical protein